MPRMRHKLFMLLLVTLLVGCDRVTKDAAVSHLGDGTVVSLVDHVLDLRYTENRDVAFNLLSFIPEGTRGRLLLVIGPLSVLAVGGWMARRRSASALEIWSLGAVLAGAIGNTSDRWLRGYVIDFVHLPHWPVFNVADVCVTLGLAGLLIEAQRRPRAPPRAAS